MTVGAGRSAEAQIASLVSPGPLAKVHASLDGIANCQKCHEPGRQVTAAKCLTCHEPIAARIRARRGVHRDAAAGCVTCHPEHAGASADIRAFDATRFDHARDTGFPLDGRHAPLARDCSRCHKTRSYVTLEADCASCHADPHRGALGAACATCHPTSRAFKDVRSGFDHSRTAFELTGAHRSVACEKCHLRNVFKGLAFASCADCHKTPHRQPLGDSCATCHTTDAWRTRKIDHARTAFPLRGRHAQVECASCHLKPATQVHLKFARCVDCHADPHRSAFKQDCSACHTERTFGGAGFDHTTTRFPLDGRHAPLACNACHKQPAPARNAAPAPRRTVGFGGLSTACAACHADPHRGELGAACATCHSTSTFKVAAYTHPRQPEFFSGAHANVTCAACHVAQSPREPRRTGVPVDGWTFRNRPFACTACHADPHLGQVGTACERCHVVAAPTFQVVGLDHARSAFPLTGRHAAIACADCHKRETGTFPSGAGTATRLRGLDAACRSCHTDPHLGQLGASCETCHSTASFRLPSYTHAGRVAFFTGAHTGVACARCHKREEAAYPSGRGLAVRYKGFGTGCAACHTDAHRGSLGAACETCHAPSAWKSISRAFHKSTLLPLEGQHLSVACAACHQAGVIKGTPTRCFDCHWLRRQDDRYRTRLGNQCEQCHRPTSWLAVSWNHSAMTGVTLSPVHRALGCEACHQGAIFKGTAPQCVTCHQADYQRAQNPNHAAAGFPVTCDLCHKVSHATWSRAMFNHSTFALVGLHATQTCATCHKNNVYKSTPHDCFTCHQADYQRSQKPNHAAAGFPTACDSCHSPSLSTWASTFNHASTYPLVGIHATVACASCHKNNLYKGTPRDCFSCHQADYQKTSNPNHAAAGFGTACDTCHNAAAATWTASFNHAVVFPLVGVHATQACAACHKNNVYKGTPRDCYGCHAAEYQRTSTPNHTAAGFPRSCDTCHRPTDATWLQGTFNHTWFPIASGRHSGNACSACHTNTANYAVFTCTTCHTRSQTDSNHRGVRGYLYDSQACYSCHPSGRAG